MFGMKNDMEMAQLERKVDWLIKCEEVRRHNAQAKKDEAEGYKVDYKKPPLRPMF